MKKLHSLLFSLLLVMLLALPVQAAASSRVLDGADLLSPSQEQQLAQTLDEISQRQSMDVVVATADTLSSKSPAAYADDLYDKLDFRKDGVLLLVSIEENDWYLSTSGYGIEAFTDRGIAHIGDQILPALSQGDFEGAFAEFAELAEDFIIQARKGQPYGSRAKNPVPFWALPLCLGIGGVFSLGIVGGMKQSLKPVRSQPAAQDYLVEGSMELTERRDLFLYRTVTKHKRPEEEDSPDSTVHRSASGTAHGGGGGKF